MTTEIITAVMRIFIILFTGVIMPLLKRWIENRTEFDKYGQLKDYAHTAVWAAEQIYNHAESADPDGSLRLKYAKHALAVTANRLGLCLTDREIETLIEAAVGELNHKKSWDALEDIEDEGMDS